MSDLSGDRCPWCLNNKGGTEGKDLYVRYHDEEWGVPVYDDRKIFEFLILEGAQAGLNWETILKRREGYRTVFEGFDASKLALWSDTQLDRALTDTRIIRNRLKVYSVRDNAKAFLKLQAEHGTFSNFIWSFMPGSKPLQNSFERLEDVPAQTEISNKLSKALKKTGMRFVGPTIIYAHMQATGMVNDHLVNCPRHEAVKKLVY